MMIHGQKAQNGCMQFGIDGSIILGNICPSGFGFACGFWGIKEWLVPILQNEE